MIPITITEEAIAEVKDIMQNKKIPEGYGLRVGVKGGGACGGTGISYLIGFDEKSEKDEEHDFNGVPVYIEKAQFMFLVGIEVDFVDSNTERGFVFNKVG